MTGDSTRSSKASWGELSKRWWIPSLYFAEGFPFALVRLMSTAYFKEFGASLQAIGMTSLFAIPWVVKFLWAPLVDAFSTKRRWLLTFQGAAAGGAVLLAIASQSPAPLAIGGAAFLLLAAVAATHDIAIDGYYLEALDRTEQARFVGFQATGYRIAMIFGGGAILALCGEVSWLLGYLLAAAVLLGLRALHSRHLPRFETPKRPGSELKSYLLRPTPMAVATAAIAAVVGLWAAMRSETLASHLGPLRKISGPMWVVLILAVAMIVLAMRAPSLKRKLYGSDSHYAMAFVDYLDSPRIGVVLAFILTFRVGEAQLQSMAYPFLRDIGITPGQYGLAHNTFGILATIIGIISAGFIIARFGLRRCIWPFVLALNALNVLYMLMAWKYQYILDDPDAGRADFWVVCVLLAFESLGAGLGTAAFSVFIMRTTKPGFKAAHFAIGTGLMNVAGILAGVVSGFLAEALGFFAFFAFTALATIPNMMLIPFLPHLDDGEAHKGGEVEENRDGSGERS